MSSPASSTTLVVIAKSPEPGRVKTRLCPPCTPDEAAMIATGALRDTLAAVAVTHAADHVLALSGPVMPWIPDEFRVIAQRGDGLDERLGAVLADVRGALLLVGMDTPQLRPELLDRSMRRLWSDGVDAVLGPADDGGYWAIGLRDPRPDAVVGVPMSVATTGSEQLRRLAELGLRTELLDRERDVDTFDDALAVAATVPGSRFAAAVDLVADRIGAATHGGPT
jgi:rSAM/selenodomain-associated transferase 1